MEHISKTLKNTVDRLSTVNSNSKYIPTVNSSNSLTVEEKIQAVLDEENIAPEGVAEMLADGLDDRKSLAYWLLLSKQTNQVLLLEVLHYVKDVAKTKQIHNKPAYFLAILRRKGVKTKFKTSI